MWRCDDIELVIELLECVQPEDIASQTPFLLHRSLVGNLFSYAERLLQPETLASERTRHFINLLLCKCGSIERLAKWRVLISLPYYNLPAPQGAITISPSTRFESDPLPWSREDQSSERFATLVETSLLEIFFIKGSLLQTLLGNRPEYENEQVKTQKLLLSIRFMILRYGGTFKRYVFGVIARRLDNLELTMALDEVFEKVKPSAKTQSWFPGIPAADNASEASQQAGDGESHPVISNQEFVEFLSGKMHDNLGLANPLQSLLGDTLLPRPVPNYENIDWTFKIECEPFEKASRDMIERNRRLETAKPLRLVMGE